MKTFGIAIVGATLSGAVAGLIVGLVWLAMAANAGATDYDFIPPPPAVVVEPPRPPIVVAPRSPRCRIVRETEHDDILNTNNYVEREECDE